MPDSSAYPNDFLSRLTAHIEKNMSNEQFGVSELAHEMSMSRSNLLRKVKKETNLSVSQLISQVRLKHAMELLRNSSMNVSEVSHQVGFNSSSYFIKCFREYYGYSPGEVGKRNMTEVGTLPDEPVTRKRNYVIAGLVGLMIVFVVGLFIFFAVSSSESLSGQKSVAVLPFKNDSNDSTNVYLINGLMEATLTNLQKIGELKVVSRTSAEKYRNTSKSIPEMAEELNVHYFVEGSGQKIGNQILLNIQLIEGATDKHLWARQYRREVKDIFALQQEIAENIAEEIQAIITPEEQRHLAKTPTSNIEAYDLFLKGKELFYKSTSESLKASIPYFKRAIEKDNKFALAYANAAMVYYYLDVFQAEKRYHLEISSCAANAMQLDPQLPESLIAKALSYAHRNEHKEAIPYLEKALEYDPNSGLVIHFLTEFYNMHVPNTAQYLKYALKGVQLDIASHDSATTSYKYLHLGNALMQTGFVDEAIRYITKSLQYDPKNPYASYAKVWFQFAKNRDANQTKDLLLQELHKDTTRIDIIMSVGKICYFARDYETAYRYFEKFLELREKNQLAILKNEDLAIAIVLTARGEKEKATLLVRSFKDYADNDQSIYKHANLSVYYSYKGDTQKAIEHMRLFSKEENYQYWILLWDKDPAFDGLKREPQFQKIMHDIERDFWNSHKKIRASLEKERLL